jgi:hypothetical protein
MTLAIGMMTKDGLLIAADTRILYSDNTSSDQQKVNGFSTNGGAFAIAHAADDTNAANSLVDEIKQEVEQYKAELSFLSLEKTIKDCMRKWHLSMGDTPPMTHLLFGACLGRAKRYALYFCEPPNTVSRVSETYKAIGEGWIFSDLFYNDWFKQGAPWPIYPSLYQLSYLMHRVKQIRPATVGGDTDVAWLRDSDRDPIWIDRLNMQCAESSGRAFDNLVAAIAAMAISVQLPKGEDTAQVIARGILQCGSGFAALSFQSRSNEIIRHEFYT